MRWQIHCGDLLDVPADVLDCSANVNLTLSGGVGGAFLLRYGPEMQAELQRYLQERGVHFVERGDVIVMTPCTSRYRAVIHAVAIDVWYESSPEIVASVMAKALHEAAALGATKVAMAALATGYGRMTMPHFAEALKTVVEREFPPLETVVLGLRKRYDVEELQALVPRLELM